MKLTITGGSLEHIRDALDAVVEGTSDANALSGVKWHTIEMGVPEAAYVLGSCELRMVSKDRQDYARWDAKHGIWERFYRCDDCDHEEWSPYEWDHHCTTQPACCDPDYRDE